MLQKHISLQSNINIVFQEFKKFKYDVIEIDEFCRWSKGVYNLYDNVDALDRIHCEFVKPLSKLCCHNSYILELKTLHSYAKQAIMDFDDINTLDERELIDWLFKYEDNELDYGDYIKTDNWEQNNLILHPLDNSIVIDCSGYSESLIFSEIYPKHYWDLFEKYKITEEEFEIAKAQHGVSSFDLRTFLKAHKP